MQAAEKEAEAEQRRGCYIDMFMRWLRGGGRRRRRRQRAKKQKILSVSPFGEKGKGDANSEGTEIRRK